MDAHIDRLYESADKIKITIPFQKDDVKERLKALVSENDLQLGIVYMQLTRGVSTRTHVFPGPQTFPVFTAYTRSLEVPESQLADGVKTMITEDIRWLRCDIKSLNLLPNILAKEEAKQSGYDEAVFERNGMITEGASSNIFIVANNTIKTHPATNLILNGITRQIIIKLCQVHNITLIEETFRTEEFIRADEAFLASTVSEVTPIVAVNDNVVGNGKPGVITRQLQSLFQSYKENECS